MAGPAYVLEQGFNVNDSANVTQYQCVVQGPNASDVQNPSGALDSTPFYGVTQEAQSDGYEVNVRTHGITRVQASGAISVGAQLVIANDDGQVESWGGYGVGVQVVGIALESATDAGDLIAMLIQRSVQTNLKLLAAESLGTSATTIAHGLDHTPTYVDIQMTTSGTAYQSTAANGTDIYVTASAATQKANIFVG